MSKQVTLTPDLIADMGTVSFLLTCEDSNVTNLKIIADLCDIAMAEMDRVYYGMHSVLTALYEGKKVGQQLEEFDELIQGMTSVGVKMGEIKLKKEIALHYFEKKTPDCFKTKKEETTEE